MEPREEKVTGGGLQKKENRKLVNEEGSRGTLARGRFENRPGRGEMDRSRVCVEHIGRCKGLKSRERRRPDLREPRK